MIAMPPARSSRHTERTIYRPRGHATHLNRSGRLNSYDQFCLIAADNLIGLVSAHRHLPRRIMYLNSASVPALSRGICHRPPRRRDDDYG